MIETFVIPASDVTFRYASQVTTAPGEYKTSPQQARQGVWKDANGRLQKHRGRIAFTPLTEIDNTPLENIKIRGIKFVNLNFLQGGGPNIKNIYCYDYEPTSLTDVQSFIVTTPDKAYGKVMDIEITADNSAKEDMLRNILTNGALYMFHDESSFHKSTHYTGCYYTTNYLCINNTGFGGIEVQYEKTNLPKITPLQGTSPETYYTRTVNSDTGMATFNIPVKLELTGGYLTQQTNQNITIYYTTDGSEPTKKSPNVVTTFTPGHPAYIVPTSPTQNPKPQVNYNGLNFQAPDGQSVGMLIVYSYGTETSSFTCFYQGSTNLIPLHLNRRGNGVAIGSYNSQSIEDANPDGKFECYFPAYFSTITNVQSGYWWNDANGINGQSVPKDSSCDIPITFENGFSYVEPPVVVVTPSFGLVSDTSRPTTGHYGEIGLTVINPTTTGFTVRAFNGYGSAQNKVGFYWMAIGKTIEK